MTIINNVSIFSYNVNEYFAALKRNNYAHMNNPSTSAATCIIIIIIMIIQYIEVLDGTIMDNRK